MRRPSNLLADAPGKRSIPEPAEKATSYLDLYGLSRPPFGKPSESGGYILFNAHRPVFERLVDHMINGTGLIIVSGEEGAGKSEMLAAAGQVAEESGRGVIVPERQAHRGIDRAHLLAAIFDDAPDNSIGEVNAQAAVRALLGPPRSVLVLDDGELLAPECHPILMSILEQRATGVTVVMTLNPALHPLSAQPPFVRLAHTRLQIPRLSPAEVRQYIERGLWIAGGTTRRLIAPDALRLIVARANGLPGSINRLMEGVFTAGFARADPLITARTVSAVVGSSASLGQDDGTRQDARPRRDDAVAPDAVGPRVDPALPAHRPPRGGPPRQDQPPPRDDATFHEDHAFREPLFHDSLFRQDPTTQNAAPPGGRRLHATRAGPNSGWPQAEHSVDNQTFGDRRFVDQGFQDRPPPQRGHSFWTGVAIPLAALAILLLGITTFLYRGLAVGDLRPPADETAQALVRSGKQSLALGDVAAARLMFQHAADAGDARAATAAGETYDPAFQVSGADPLQAAGWYRRAIELGDRRASSLLQRLQAGPPRAAPP